MKTKIILIISLAISMFSLQVLANDAREKVYLIQMMNQLDALKPLIIAADNEQIKNARVKFHYTSYRDSNGKPHNGLLEDINEIKVGIQERVNQTMSEPHRFIAIKGDYLDFKNVKSTSVGNVAEIHNVK
jgi:RAQPRD family integrative conjugative element protein